jgi:hypothetical protein
MRLKAVQTPVTVDPKNKGVLSNKSFLKEDKAWASLSFFKEDKA